MLEDFISRKKRKLENMLENVTFDREIYNEMEDRPCPVSIAEFLEDPYKFHPTDDFIKESFVEDESLLTHCIKLQNIKAVDVLLKCGANANQTSKKGVTPISAASHKGNVLIMQMLIDSGAHVNSVNISGSTALIQASHFGHMDAVKLLLRHNANADFANQKGTTALMRASQEGHVEISQALLEHGADANRRNHELMNALMLASQRGHAEIVKLLIKSGAAMDEQTSQGSTALMLACKRGHEKCAEVLVSMGAEIYMRDRRYRTARDTATRRNHISLLCWLDTQVQIRKIQELKQKIRATTIGEFRKHYLAGRLRLSISEQFVEDLVHTVSGKSTAGSELKLMEKFEQSDPSLPLIAKSPDATMQEIQKVVNNEYDLATHLLPSFPLSFSPAGHVRGFIDWQWGSLMNKCMGLPSGVFELVMDFLPYPRVWQWSLLKMPRRCKLAPQQAMIDMSIMMDEILKDSLIFKDVDQRNQLIKIARSPQMYSLLTNYYGMPPALVDMLQQWSDIQSILVRTNEHEVTFKYPIARRMLVTTIALYRWFRQRNSSIKCLDLIPPILSGTGSTINGAGEVGLYSSNLKYVRFVENEEGELIEATDAGGEEFSDNEIDALPIEPDTENEYNPNDEADNILGDSDNEEMNDVNLRANIP